MVDGWVYKHECKLMINFDFIKELEGVKKDGYVPDVKNSSSGVTIASGFDLGARSKSDLLALGLPQTLVDKLTPYLGYKKDEAVEFLAKHPLSVNEQELELLISKVKESETRRIVDLYNRTSKTTKFECLPWQAQTVIASVSYQYGYLPSETENFWKQAIEQDWSAMFNNLMKFGDKYPTRREKEAGLIKEIK
ncbi:pesticin C-terminus-like muramidase [Vibrio furnissii]|uniref:pesticin C-terminus-like muramidase n=1 Tax=Vibrio furnissii TaxID=29494 RepID=UPI003747FB0C